MLWRTDVIALNDIARSGSGRVLGPLLLLLGCWLGEARADGAPSDRVAVFTPQVGLKLAELMQLVAEQDPSLQQELLAIDEARAQVRQSRLWENPVLDAAVGTIPLGTPNPPELPAPLSNVPNYGVGLSLHPDLARRPQRQGHARAQLGAAQAQLRASIRERALGLARVLGMLAVTALRLDAKHGLAEQARDALRIAQIRVESGYNAPLDASRAEIEQLRLEEQTLALEGELAAALASCAEYLGTRCQPFPSSQEAREFLIRWPSQAADLGVPSPAALEQRPGLQVLLAQRLAAEADARLAQAQHIPDPTVRLGYLYDTFVASGNQLHSLNVSLSLPLPVFDHGQAAAQAAAARIHRLETERQRRITAAQAHIEALRTSLFMQRRRLETLENKTLPRARAILADLRRAFELRTLRLTELLQARNTLDELLLAEADTLSDSFSTTLDLLGQLP
jgi:outer membrane protein, heavy metal efflux system